MRQIRLFLLACACLGLLLSMPAAWGQFSGTVTGTVVDPTGALVPNATVRLTNDATNQTTNATTNASGVYTFPSLAPGNYHLTSTAAGFSRATVPVILQTNQTLNAKT